MLQGKIICDIGVHGREYRVKVGSVTVDITDDVRALIAQEVTDERVEHEQAITELRAKHADTVERYNQIQRIVLAGGVGMPTG